jgi:hypothetical protein
VSILANQVFHSETRGDEMTYATRDESGNDPRHIGWWYGRRSTTEVKAHHDVFHRRGERSDKFVR